MDLQSKYREVLLQGIGKEVLADLLTTLGFLTTHAPDETLKIAQHNLAVAILAKCGILARGTMPEIIDAISYIKPKEEK